MTSTTRLLSLMLCGAIACAFGACVAKSEVTTCGITGVLCPSGFHCAAAQGICIEDAKTICGDLHKDEGEACDDGNNIDGDGCSHDCKSTEECGNGVLDKPFPDDPKNPKNEDCDTPLKIDPRTNLFCSAKCKFEQCGNGVTDTDIGEICDDGNTVGGDGCAADCKSTEKCGNGKLDQPFKDANGTPDLNDPRNEVCDDGNNLDGDRCSADCRSTLDCGNGKIDPGEECDDGTDTDGTSRNGDDKDCRSDCIINRCGDGHPNTHGLLHPEACDGGLPSMDMQGTQIPAPAHSRVATPRETADCNIDCTPAACGDGKVNHSFHPATAPAGRTEQCDDGPGNNKDSADCTAGCQVNTCGDGLQDTEGNHQEGCDDGNRDDRDACSNACVLATCGDGIVGPGEACDLGKDADGNNLNTDGSACPGCVAAKCGDGKVHIGFEECDGADVGTAHCSATCHLEKCGNGIIDPGEECDKGDGNDNNGDCRKDCILNRCGDGFVNLNGTHPEKCEGHPPVAQGDHTVTPIETADCNINCTAPACGDGILNRHFKPMKLDGTGFATTTEQCDDGARDPDNGCSVDCQFERCGNGIVDPNEECDNGDGNSDNGDCRSDCVINRCGDGHVNTSSGPNHEACDGAPPAAAGDRNATPTDTNGCNSNCTLATCGDSIVNRVHKVEPSPSTLTEQCDPPGPGCSATCRLENCGNGVPDPGEQCDDGNGHDGDACENDCTLPRCGNGIPDVGEECDDGNTNNKDDCTNDCKKAVCGDGFTRSEPANPLNKEDCDDPTLQSLCPYTPVETACLVCNASCKSVPGTTLFCGDDVVDGPEVCDPGTRLCGACTADCSTVTSQAATGLILAAPGGEYAAGDNFLLSDGVHPTTFEFTVAGGLLDDGNTPIAITGTETAAEVAIKISTAIGDAGLHIDRRLVGGAVILTNQRATATGTAGIVNNVGAASFATDGMSGGQGGLCLAAQPCRVAIECQSNSCVAGFCTAP